MTTTPRGAPELVSAQALPEQTVNEQIRRTEAGAARFPVADRVTTPPGSCTDGATYLIIATATGAFTGKENQLATAVGTNAASGWYYRTLGAIDEGVVAYVQDEDVEYKWSGVAWATYGGPGVSSTASTTEALTGTDSAKAVTPDALAALWEQGADVASAGTVSLGEGGYFVITGTTTITDVDFVTDKAGRKAWVKFAGVLTLTHNASTLILPTGANITTAAGDTACFVSEGTDAVRCVAYQRASGQALAAGAVSLTMASTVTQSGTPVATSVGFLGAPQMADQDDYTLALTDSGGHYYHVSATPHTLTIPANGSIAFPIGTVIAIVNENGAGAITLAITTDTLRWGSSTGSRTIAANGTATLLKVTSTVWRLTGDGIT